MDPLRARTHTHTHTTTTHTHHHHTHTHTHTTTTHTHHHHTHTHTLTTLQLNSAEDYEKRSAIRKAIRNLKGSKSKKQVGSSNYRRAGWQAPKSVSIPNSVTGNIMGLKVNITENTLETPSSKTTTSYLKSNDVPYGNQGRRKSSGTGVTNGISTRSSPRESVSSYSSVTPEPKELAEPEKVSGIYIET